MKGPTSQSSTKKPIVYLAGPITNVSINSASLWRDIIAHQLFLHGVSSFNPVGAWTVCYPRDYDLVKKIQYANDMALTGSDCMIACFQGVESRGTDHEIQLAEAYGIPVVVYAAMDYWRSNILLSLESFDSKLQTWCSSRFPGEVSVTYDYSEVTDLVLKILGKTDVL